MELEGHVGGLCEQLAVAAEAGGEDARALAQRLTAPLESAVRLMLLEVLAAATAEITRELAPGSVELRLRGAGPEFVVVAPGDAIGAGRESCAGEPRAGGGSLPAASGTGEGGVSRVNLRLPDPLKSRVERAADREGLSINSWLVRAAAAAAERRETAAARDHSSPRGGRSYTGWSR